MINQRIDFKQEIKKLLDDETIALNSNFEISRFSNKEIALYLWNIVDQSKISFENLQKRVSTILNEWTKQSDQSHLINVGYGLWAYWKIQYERPKYEIFNSYINPNIVKKYVYDIDYLQNNPNKLKTAIKKEAIGSTVIEGSTINNLSEYRQRSNDDEEKIIVDNYVQIMLDLLNMNKEWFGLMDVLNIHKLFFQNTHVEKQLTTGSFRNHQNFISGGYKTCDPLKIREEMQAWLEFWKIKPQNFNEAMLRMIYLHLWYEKLHPFADGNGRSGRILLSYYLYYHDVFSGILLISEKISINRIEYIKRISQGDLAFFVNFFKDRIFD